jgi:hypothetical protein
MDSVAEFRPPYPARASLANRETCVFLCGSSDSHAARRHRFIAAPRHYMLQPRLGQAKIPATPQAQGAHTLRDRPFDSGPQTILGVPIAAEKKNYLPPNGCSEVYLANDGYRESTRVSVASSRFPEFRGLDNHSRMCLLESGDPRWVSRSTAGGHSNGQNCSLRNAIPRKFHHLNWHKSCILVNIAGHPIIMQSAVLSRTRVCALSSPVGAFP